MDEALELAARLGKAIAADRRFIELRQTEKKIREDPGARELAVKYAEQTDKIRRLEEERKPVEVADKRRLEELHSEVASHPLLKELARVQADFTAFMDRINHAIDGELQPESDDEQQANGKGCD